jgi:hypothetical protein
MAKVPVRATPAVVGLELPVRPAAMADQRAGLSAAVIPRLGEARPFDAPVIGVDALGVCAHESSVGAACDSSRVTAPRTRSAVDAPFRNPDAEAAIPPRCTAQWRS